MLYAARNLRKTYGERTVLDIDELHIQAGNIYGLLGPNGSGKSTLLSLLAFLDTPSSGNLWYRGNLVRSHPNELLALRREVILVDQHPILFSTSVFKNVEFGLKVRGIPARQRKRIVEESLDLVGMRAFIHERSHHLSGGETQRLAIARALACSPRVLLFDEPTASVDVENQIAIENIIHEVHQEKNMSIILCTHDMLQVSRLAQETIFLFDGRRSASTHENIFSAQAYEQDGMPLAKLTDQIAVPLASSVQGKIKLAIAPQSIKLFPVTAQTGKPQRITGTVMQLTREGRHIRALVDMGVPLSVRIPLREFTSLSICVGDRVLVDCPAHGVSILSQDT
jgi:tungstate transport system ATP-binding protein